MSTLFVFIYIAVIFLGWYANKLLVNLWLYFGAFALFLGSMVVANQYVQESTLAVNIAFAVTFFAFGYIMRGHRKKR